MSLGFDLADQPERRDSLGLQAGYEQQIFAPEEEPDQVLEDSRYGRLGLEWNQRIGLNPADTLQLNWQAYWNYFSGFGAGQGCFVRLNCPVPSFSILNILPFECTRHKKQRKALN